MSTATFTVGIATTDREDKAAIKYHVDTENGNRTRQNAYTAIRNAELELQTPPGTPLPHVTVMPATTVNEIKSAYEAYFLVGSVQERHRQMIQNYKQAVKDDANNKAIIEALGEATQSQKNAALAALTS